MKRITTLSLALGFAVALAGTASAQVKLAVGGPITGPSAATGAQMKNGVDQAAADINAAGGIDVGRGLVDTVLHLRAGGGARSGDRAAHGEFDLGRCCSRQCNRETQRQAERGD